MRQPKTRSIPPPPEIPAMPLGGGWIASTKTGRLTFTHPGRELVHLDLGGALQAGMLPAVAHARGYTQRAIAAELRVTINSVSRWWVGRRTPAVGMYREAFVRFLLRQ